MTSGFFLSAMAPLLRDFWGLGFWIKGIEFGLRVHIAQACSNLARLRDLLGGSWVLLKNKVPFRILFIRVPYYIGDPKWDPNIESYPHGK